LKTYLQNLDAEIGSRKIDAEIESRKPDPLAYSQNSSTKSVLIDALQCRNSFEGVSGIQLTRIAELLIEPRI
jgi:hypothetical protein